jgi:UDP-glucose 4-epimerase
VAGQARQLIFLSTVKVNGEVSDVPFSPEDSPRPQDSYGRSKLAAELILTQPGMPPPSTLCVTIVRLPLVYGIGVKGNLGVLEKAIRKGVPLPFLSVCNKRDMVSLANLSSLLWHFMQRPAQSSGIWMVSDGCSQSTAGICRLMGDAMGIKPRLWPMPVFLLGWILRCLGKASLIDRLLGNLQLDITKTLAAGWVPVQSPQEGFIEMYGQPVEKPV